MFYCYKEIQDEFGNRLNIRTGRPTNDRKTAERQLAHLENGEVRNESHITLAVKRGAETKWVQDLLCYRNV